MVGSAPRLRIFACLAAAAALACAPAPPAPSVIVVSLDGTTPDAARDAGMETVSRLVRRGASASRLVPVFPTNTFPNHVTLVTGVAPATHGIVSNVFRDPERGLFRYSNDPSWIEVEPLWSIADRHGIVSAAFHWVGSQGAWRDGGGPRYWRAFDPRVPETEKVDAVLGWLDLPDPAERPHLVTTWFHGADAAAHLHGPGAAEVGKTLREQDAVLGRLVAGLEARDAFRYTTLLVLSDHGMLAVEREVDLQAALEAADVEATVFGGGGFVTVSTGGREATQRAVEVARSLSLEAYPRDRAPPELGLSHPRFGDVVVLAPPGTALRRRDSDKPAMRGAHGYRSDTPEMGALFVAVGPGVSPGTRLRDVAAIDVAPTVLALLGIEPPGWMEGRAIPGIAGPRGASDGSGR